MQNYESKGDVLELTAPAGGVTSGEGYIVGSIFVVATHDAAAGESFRGLVTGIAELTKATGETWTAGDALYWDEAPGPRATTNPIGRMHIGCAAEDAASAAALGKVRLNGISVDELESATS